MRRTTTLRGKRESEAQEYMGKEVFLVESDPAKTPKGDLDAIVGKGLGKGFGLVGKGGKSNGTGVRAVGGSSAGGVGGDVAGMGVLAQGGDGLKYGTDNVHAGVGVIAIGGEHFSYPSAEGELRQPNGGGVVGISGGVGDIPSWERSAQVGLFGRGGDELEHTIPVEPGADMGTVVVGAPYPGVGVVGVGGSRRTKDGESPDVRHPGGGAGVFGIAAGGRPFIPEIPRDVGVVGCSYVLETGRGALFATRNTPQLNLHPVALPLSEEGAPEADGIPGDLLVREFTPAGGQVVAELWFCMAKNVWRRVALL
ncbi:hypothetical protein [Streptomyces sp. enrichment culture]|uniref:hypothetical protein n=1 Tax=Streptomyces sp. enrichment culture TaxID=1795815 RepID=UPI003F558FA2